MSFNNVCKTLSFPVLKELIEEDVFVVSKAMHVYSIYVNYLFRHMLQHDLERGQFSLRSITYFNSMDTTELRQIMFALQGKTSSRYTHVLNAEFAEMMRIAGVTGNIDTAHRASIFQEAIHHFETMLKNNIVVNMKKRVINFLMKLPSEGAQALSFRSACALTTRMLSEDEDAPLFLGFSLGNLLKAPYKFIPLLYLMQQKLTDANVGSFRVVPLFRARMQSIHITNSGLVDLMTRFFKRSSMKLTTLECKEMAKSPRSFWSKYFDVLKLEKFYSNGAPKKVFWQLVTNGVQASVIMKHINKIEKDPNEKPPMEMTHDHNIRLDGNKKLPLPFPKFDYVIGIDPGVRLALGGVVYNVKTGKRILIKESSRSLHAKSGFFARKAKLERHSRILENAIKASNEELHNIGPSSADFTAYTRHQLGFVNARFRLYRRKVFRRLNFDSHIRRHATVDKLVSQLCKKNARTLLFYGDATAAPFIRG